jgi:hypothetical protein
VNQSLLEENRDLKLENSKLKEEQERQRLQETTHAPLMLNQKSFMPRFNPSHENPEWRNIMEEIKNKTFEETTSDEMRHFIEYLQQDVDSFEGRAKDIIRSNIELLGPKMYTSPMSFVNELVQNFDDARYSGSACPCLRIVLSEKFLLFSSNQVVLQPSEVWSITSIGQSTKIKGKKFLMNTLTFY